MLTVGVGSAPEGGKATAEAARTVARWLGIAPSRLDLVSGAASRSKRFRVAGMTAEGLRRAVAERLAVAGGRSGEPGTGNRP